MHLRPALTRVGAEAGGNGCELVPCMRFRTFSPSKDRRAAQVTFLFSGCRCRPAGGPSGSYVCPRNGIFKIRRQYQRLNVLSVAHFIRRLEALVALPCIHPLGPSQFDDSAQDSSPSWFLRRRHCRVRIERSSLARRLTPPATA